MAERRSTPLCWCRTGHESGPCPVCLRPLDHHPDSAVPDGEWRGRARMAHARRHAELPLDPTDRHALHLHPDCPPLLGDHP